MIESVAEKLPLETLLDDNLQDMIRCIAMGFRRKYARTHNHYMITDQDLISEGTLATVTAYKSFDPTRGILFRTYAYPYIRYAMQTYCRKFSHPLSISEKCARDDFGSIMNIPVIHIDQLDEDTEFDIPMGSGLNLPQELDVLYMTGFTDFERATFVDYVFNQLSLQELSHKYGRSKTRMGVIMNQLKDRIKTKVQYHEQND